MDRAARALEASLAAMRAIPRILTLVLWGSVVSGVGLAWFWFLRHDLTFVKWLAAPWLVILAAPQAGLWLLTSTLRELLSLPERLLALKSGLADQGQLVLQTIRRADDRPEGGLLRRLRDAYALHGELSQIIATRTLLHRFTGPFAALIGPVSFLVNCAIILIGLVQLLFIVT